ncbi:MAG: Iron-sulfur cluster assembly ATPase protein SufC [Candidatus Bipolaricaulis sibiricus]|uniref:Iron-sulfur cluster assembly ATPase protein SufC n=1 Tax=Bipolaricaulis sibiricus TaxID=2501609 RepID=A0A410FTC0_BIPS1|nr:MAG: Iron-sulfur cluster assembly ATPase protein SufC [Candidatus Bipolaricaulis sibiricus]
MPILAVDDLHVAVGEKPVLRGVDLALEPGRVHALMGPNGSGKSTLALSLAGSPGYVVTRGRAILDGADLLALPPVERARKGLFLGFQYPPEIEGVSLREFLRLACAERGQGFCEFHKSYPQAIARLKMDAFDGRELNVGFSGGEKKRSELLQLLLLKPKVALLDEPDSGVDVDALRLIAGGIRDLAESGAAVLIITHYPRILDHVPLSEVFVLDEGRVVEQGGPELAHRIGEQGFEVVRG